MYKEKVDIKEFIMELIGNFLIALSLIFITFGVFGIYRFKNFYQRALISANIDIVGYITLILGLIFKNGFSFFSIKLIFIMIITLILNPLVSHAIVRSAYISGYKIGKD